MNKVSMCQKIKSVSMTLPLVLEIEQEIGALPVFFNRLKTGHWRTDEIVTTVQMILQKCGETRDWKDLGQQMVIEGLEYYAGVVADVLSPVLTGLKAQTA